MKEHMCILQFYELISDNLSFKGVTQDIIYLP